MGNQVCMVADGRSPSPQAEHYPSGRPSHREQYSPSPLRTQIPSLQASNHNSHNRSNHTNATPQQRTGRSTRVWNASPSVSPNSSMSPNEMTLPIMAEGRDKQRRLEWLEDFGEGRSDQRLSNSQLHQATSSSKSTFLKKVSRGTQHRPVTVKNSLPATVKSAGLTLEEKTYVVDDAFAAAVDCPYARQRRAAGLTSCDKKTLDGSEFRLFLLYIERYVTMWRLFDQVDQEGDESVEFKDFTNELLALSGGTDDHDTLMQSYSNNANHDAYRNSRDRSYGDATTTTRANIQAQRMVRTDEQGRSVLYFDKYADLVLRKSLLKEQGDDDFNGCKSRFPHVAFEDKPFRGSWKEPVVEQDVVRDMWTETARKKWARREQMSAEEHQQRFGNTNGSYAPTPVHTHRGTTPQTTSGTRTTIPVITINNSTAPVIEPMTARVHEVVLPPSSLSPSPQAINPHYSTVSPARLSQLQHHQSDSENCRPTLLHVARPSYEPTTRDTTAHPVPVTATTPSPEGTLWTWTTN